MKADLTFNEIFFKFQEIDSTQSESVSHLIKYSKTNNILSSSIFLNSLSMYFITQRFTKKLINALQLFPDDLDIDQKDSMIFVKIRDKKLDLADQLTDIIKSKESNFFDRNILKSVVFLMNKCAKEDDNMSRYFNEREANKLGIPDVELPINEVMDRLNIPKNKSQLERAIKRHKSGDITKHDLLV